MAEGQKLASALEALRPIAQAILDVTDNVDVLADIEGHYDRTKAAIEELELRGKAIQAKAEKDITEAKVFENAATDRAAQLEAQAKAHLEEATSRATVIVDTARHDATAMAEGIMAERRAEIDSLINQVDSAKAELAALQKAIPKLREQHNEVLASINSLKSRLG